MHHEVASWTWNAQDETLKFCSFTSSLYIYYLCWYIKIVLSDNNNRWVNALFGVSHGYPRWCHKCDDGLIRGGTENLGVLYHLVKI
ncbi:hypothetical protein Bca4012_074983 [Brassica carinata]